MKTKRIKMAHSLINSYNLTESLRMYNSQSANFEQMSAFHNPYYLKYLQTWVSPQANKIVEQYVPTEEQVKIRNDDSRLGAIFKVNQSFDCPGFEGLYNFCSLAAGSSIDAADLVIAGQGDVVINWSGGFHHAKKSEASGFCYINDNNDDGKTPTTGGGRKYFNLILPHREAAALADAVALPVEVHKHQLQL